MLESVMGKLDSGSMKEKIDMSLDNIIEMRSIAGGGGVNNGLVKKKRRSFNQEKQVARLAAQSIKRSSNAGFSRLFVSNLASTVSAEDLQALFGGVGSLLCPPVLHFDQLGRFLGTAAVAFERQNEAKIAVDRYNGVTLDQRPIRIEVCSCPNSVLRSKSLVDRMDLEQLVQQRPPTNKKIQKNGKSVQPDISSSQLDMELDSYMEKVRTSTIGPNF